MTQNTQKYTFFEHELKFHFEFAIQFFPIDNPTFTTNDNLLIHHSSLSRIYNLCFPFQEFQTAIEKHKIVLWSIICAFVLGRHYVIIGF